MTIVLPGIIFWFLILAAVWIISSFIWDNGSDIGIIFWTGLSIIGTIAYIFYAIYWIWSHWHKIPVHITLT